MKEVPASFRLAYSKEQIQARTAELGRELAAWVAEEQARSAEQVLAVCVLRGAIFFFSDLLRSIPHSVEPAFCRTWSYSSQTNEQSTAAIRIKADEIDPKGRSLLLVDDICDSGETLSALEREFHNRGASKIASVVLVHRSLASTTYSPQWAGFSHSGDEWFVGCGMEDKNKYANYPDLYTITSAAK